MADDHNVDESVDMPPKPPEKTGFFRRLFGRKPEKTPGELDVEKEAESHGNGSAAHDDDHSHDKPKKKEKTICLYDESPYYILKVAAQANLNEVKRLLVEDEQRLKIKDYRGQNVFHHSAAWQRIAILEHLYTYKDSPHYEINARDKLGNTPLHFAIEKNQIQSIDWLLKHGADLTVKNNNSAAPVHMAVEMNKIDIVKMIVAQDHEIIHLPGDFGYTPLQYACSKDLPEIARYLLVEGADLFRNNDIGYSAIHAATRNGSANVVNVLIEFAESKGISGESLIHTLDKEKNLPLHSAVNSGDIKAVTVCLKAGADINAQHSEDKQSAVHYAASKGSVEIIKVMFEAQPAKVENCLHCRDILEQTPLHKAAGFNHVAVVEFLMASGASMNAQDSERRTPLILAASKGAVKVVNFLLAKRANTSLREKDNRNFLHMAIMTGLRLGDLEVDSLKNLKQLLNERDDFGCCPIHYASKTGQLSTLKGLLVMGAQVTLKDNDKQSPLHFAAKFGKLQTAKKLLNSEQGALLINEVDGDGRTPLLIAAMYGHYKVIALLVRKGAQMSKDFRQNTALHLAAEYGNHESVILLVGLAPHLLNATNKDGNTALHLAAQNGHALIVDYLMTADAKFEYNTDGSTFFDLAIVKFQPDAAAAVIRHSRCEEAMQLKSTLGSPMIGLIQHLPKICILFLDKCMTYAATNKKSREFYIQYDFSYLQTPEYMVQESKQEGKGKVVPLLPLNTMVKHNRVDCLAHPLCVNFLQRKWSTYGALIYNFRIGLYVLFLALLTSVSYDVDQVIGDLKCETCTPGYYHREQQDNSTTTIAKSYYLYNVTTALPPTTFTAHIHDDLNFTTFSDNLTRFNDNLTTLFEKNETMVIATLQTPAAFEHSEDELREGGLMIRMVLVALFCLGNFTLQFFTLVEQKLAYFFDFAHYIELGLYISTFCMTIPSIVNMVNTDLQFISSVISMFLGWINLLLYMQRFDFFGIYIVMFVEIFKTVIRVFVVFSFIIVAFALTLTVVFKATDGPNTAFINPFVSLIATLAMMLGELNYIALISPTVSGERELLSPTLTYVVYVAFIILIPILLTNLLVGLAVGNIESVQKNARLKRLAMQVDFFTALERRLPKSFIKRRTQDHWKFYPNQSGWKFLQKIRETMKNSGGGSIGGDEEGEEGRTDFAYLLEELTVQSRHLSGLGTRFDNQQDLLKLILQKMDAELFNDGKFLEPDNESGGEDDAINLSEKASSSQTNSTEFHSPAARAQWHAVTTRFAAFKKPKANQFALVDEDDEEQQQPRQRNRRGARASSSSSQSEMAPLIEGNQ